MRILTNEETGGIIAAAADRPARHRLILRLLLEHHLTPNEICRLTGRDVKGAQLTVTSKTGATRHVQLRSAAAEDLSQLVIRADQQLLGLPGRPATSQTVRAMLDHARTHAGISERVSPHQRHALH